MSDSAAAEPALADDPFARFAAWLAEATASEPNDPNAMTVATATPDGVPSARIQLLKGFDAAGFLFYGNLESRKAQELAGNPHAALLFHWKSLRRQVRIEGTVRLAEPAEADAYYASRPYGSRIGAWASAQSRPLADRAELEARVAAAEARFPDGAPVPRPPHWGGWRLTPRRFEFWRDMPFRLHERLVFTPDGDGWAVSRLYP